jgi:mycothiol synthase
MPTDDPGEATPVRIRPMEMADIPAVVRLINAADTVDQADEGTSEAEFRHWVAQSGGPGSRFVALGPADELAGYGDLHHQPGDEGAWGWVVVHPAWRRHGIGMALAEQVLDRVRHLGVAWIDYATDVRLREANAWLARLGYEPVRTYMRLRLPPEVVVPAPAYPADFQPRTFRREDLAAVRAILAAPFADHRNPQATAAGGDEAAEDLGQPWFDPRSLFVAETEEGQMAGLCWAYINYDENRRRGEAIGWINDLEVARAHRRQGLGRALLLDGIHWLHGQGMQAVDLWVDSGNREARNLYAALGFQMDKSVVDYRHFLRVGRPTGTSTG